MKSALSTIAAVALVPVLAACGGDNGSSSVEAGCEPEWEFSSLEEGSLRVAAVPSLPALEIDGASGEATGIEASLLEDFAERSCRELQWQSLAGPAGVTAMSEKRADVAAGGWWISEERGESIGQSDPIWYDYSATLSADGVDNVEDLAGMKVGVEGGSVYQENISSVTDHVKEYQSIDAMLQDLEAGRIDAVIATSSQLGYQAEVRGMDDFEFVVLEPDTTHPELTAIGEVNLPYTQGNDELGAALDEFISEAREDGTMEELLTEFGLTDPSNFSGKA